MWLSLAQGVSCTGDISERTGVFPAQARCPGDLQDLDLGWLGRRPEGGLRKAQRDELGRGGGSKVTTNSLLERVEMVLGSVV